MWRQIADKQLTENMIVGISQRAQRSSKAGKELSGTVISHFTGYKQAKRLLEGDLVLALKDCFLHS